MADSTTDTRPEAASTDTAGAGLTDIHVAENAADSLSASDAGCSDESDTDPAMPPRPRAAVAATGGRALLRTTAPVCTDTSREAPGRDRLSDARGLLAQNPDMTCPEPAAALRELGHQLSDRRAPRVHHRERAAKSALHYGSLSDTP